MEERKRLVKFKADLFKALANPLRIQILDELRDGERTVSELKERLEIELPNVSQQLSILKAKHLVVYRKQGNNIFYSITDPTIFEVLDVVKKVFNNHLVDLKAALESDRGGKRKKSDK